MCQREGYGWLTMTNIDFTSKEGMEGWMKR